MATMTEGVLEQKIDDLGERFDAFEARADRASEQNHREHAEIRREIKDGLAGLRAEMNDGSAELRAAITGLYRLIAVGGVSLLVTILAGAVGAIVSQLY